MSTEESGSGIALHDAVRAVAVGSAARAAADPTASRLALAVGRINRRIRSTRDGLGHGTISTLSSIIRRGPLRPGDVGRIEGIAAPTVTRILADLERRGLIERRPDPSDGRSCFVSATAAGIELVGDARAETAQRAALLLRDLDAEELDRLHEALDVLEALAVADQAGAAEHPSAPDRASSAAYPTPPDARASA
jgi:DNA-binding MarR family transcriptional regulator